MEPTEGDAMCDRGPGECVTGDRLEAALRLLGLWFDGNILAVKIVTRPKGFPMAAHYSSWYAEAEVAMIPSTTAEGYQFRVVRVPVHPGRSCDVSAE